MSSLTDDKKVTKSKRHWFENTLTYM